MDITQRQITKIAREAGKFISRTIKEEGVGTAEFDLIHVVRKRPGITQSEICRILERIKALWPSRLPIWRQRAIFNGRAIHRMAAVS